MDYKDIVQARVKEVELLYNQIIRQASGLRKTMEKLVKYANTIIESGEFDARPYRMSDTAWQKRATDTIKELLKRGSYSTTNEVLSAIYIDLRDTYGVVLDQLRKDYRENNDLLRYPSAFEAISGDDMVRSIFDSILLAMFPEDYFQDEVLMQIEGTNTQDSIPESQPVIEDSAESESDENIQSTAEEDSSEQEKAEVETQIAGIVSELAELLNDTSFGNGKTFEFICDNMECHWGYLATQYRRKNQTQVSPSRYTIVIENARTRSIFEKTARRLIKIEKGKVR